MLTSLKFTCTFFIKLHDENNAGRLHIETALNTIMQCYMNILDLQYQMSILKKRFKRVFFNIKWLR